MNLIEKYPIQEKINDISDKIMHDKSKEYLLLLSKNLV